MDKLKAFQLIILETPVFIFYGFLVSIFAAVFYITTFFVSIYMVIGILSLAYWFFVMEKTPSPDEIKRRKDIFVVIVGAGISGLCAAIKLKQQRIRYVLIESSEHLGGTWYENKYPGCGCDIMSHLYCLSFKLNPFWSKTYPKQAELLSYLEDTCDYYGIKGHIKFGTKVERCQFNENKRKWKITTSKGDSFDCNYVVSGIGILHVPKFPDVDGKDRFKGVSLHTSQWNESSNWTDQRVAVIGTGCSAVQVVPSIAPKCKQLHVFQRSPAWVLPRPDFPYPRFVQKCFQLFPFLMTIHRWCIFARQEFFFLAMFTKGSKIAELFTKDFRKHMEKQIENDHLKAKLIPDYDIGCKRITVSNEYLPAFNRKNVHLTTDPITEITESGIRVSKGDGATQDIEVDSVVYATGFDVMMSLTNVDVESRGKLLRDVWGDYPNAYLGIMSPGFPNFFNLMGPMTVLGHNSMVWMLERQVHFLINAIIETVDRNCSTVEVKESANQEFQSFIKETMKKRVFASGCTSWYQNKTGLTFLMWPLDCVSYWWQTLWLKTDHFIFSK